MIHDLIAPIYFLLSFPGYLLHDSVSDAVQDGGHGGHQGGLEDDGVSVSALLDFVGGVDESER